MMDALDQFRLDGRTAIVTGGAGLLGAAFADVLTSAGAECVIADIDQESGQEIADRLRDRGRLASFFALDVTDPGSCADLAAFAESEHGGVGVLVNSAALDPKFDPEHAEEQSSSFEDYSLSAWKQALEVNLTGMFLVTQAIARIMVDAGKGSIINICSTYGLVGPDQRMYQRPGEPARFKPVYYSTTKAGVLGFTRYLATYYAGTEIRVNALTPGGVFNDHDEQFVQAYSARTVLGRMARKDEMNGALLYLASDASSYMTGANLVVDGGWTAW